MNRVMQAKQLKIRRYKQKRRGYQKRWEFRTGMVNVGSSANTALMAEFHGNAKVNPQQDRLDRIFPGVIKTPAGRQEVEKLLAKTVVHKDQYVVARDGKINRILMFWNHDHTEYFFVKHIVGLGELQRSVTYSSRISAVTAFQSATIKWFGTLAPSQATG